MAMEITDQDKAHEEAYYAEMRRNDDAVDVMLAELLAGADEDESEEGEADEPW